MTVGGFQRLNTRAAKVNGEMVVWIRQQYARMMSYPMIREGLKDNFGVTLSVQQITRIAKGESFAQLPTLPTNREVDLTMHLNALRGGGGLAPQDEVAASEARMLAMLQAENAAREQRNPYSLEEIERREREVMGLKEGAGLDKLLNAAQSPAASTKPKLATATKLVNAEKLLETLKDEQNPTNDAVAKGD